MTPTLHDIGGTLYRSGVVGHCAVEHVYIGFGSEQAVKSGIVIAVVSSSVSWNVTVIGARSLCPKLYSHCSVFVASNNDFMIGPIEDDLTFSHDANIPFAVFLSTFTFALVTWVLLHGGSNAFATPVIFVNMLC